MRIYIPLIFTLMLLTACTESYSFSGKGENWKMTYQVTTSGQTEENKITLKYIGQGDPPKRIIYSVDNGDYSGDVSYPENGILVEGSMCNNCSILQKNDEINVDIKWGEKSEKFILKH